MAVSGFVLFLFVLGHLAGNLQFFLGPEAINRYGHFLQSNPEVIWPARLILLLMVGLHIWSAVKLSVENKAARPVAYAQYQPVGEGVSELRLDYGPGYRVYFGQTGQTLVILLCGGDKRTQGRDIRQAQQYWGDYQERESK